MSKRKYEKGKRICSVSDFEKSDATFFIWNDRTRHRSVLISLQYRTLESIIYAGRLYEAQLIEGAKKEATDEK